MSETLERVTPAIYSVLRRMGLSAAEVDDAMQTVLIQMVRRWDRIATLEPRQIRAYACAVASGVAIDLGRKRSRANARQEPLEDQVVRADGAGPEAALDRQRELELLDGILGAMPAERRAVFVLFEIEELTSAEIAVRLGIPLGTVNSRLRKARDEFRRAAERVRVAEQRGGRHR